MGDDVEVRAYRQTVDQVGGVLSVRRTGAPALGINEAVGRYLDASRELFGAVGTGQRAVAVLGGDLRLVAELADADAAAEGLVVAEAAARTDFAADMDALAALAAGEEPDAGVLAVADDDPVASAGASLDAIVSAGLDAVGAVVAAATFPSAAELQSLVGGLFGAAAGEALRAAIIAVETQVGGMVRAATKVLRSIVDKLVALLGQPAVDDLTTWAKKLVGVRDGYELCFGVPRLRTEAAALAGVADAMERATRIAAIADSHDRWQGYIVWGARGLGWAGPKLHAAAPWGSIVVAAVAVVLVLGSGWLTADHLDSFDLTWLPDRFDGVGAALA